jgi:hypothetical protein
LLECRPFGARRASPVALKPARHQHIEFAHATPALPAQPREAVSLRIHDAVRRARISAAAPPLLS